MTTGSFVDPATGAYQIPAASFTGNPGQRTGLYALEDVDLFNVLCDARLAPRLGDTGSLAVYGEALNYIAGRRATMIVDIPQGLNRIRPDGNLAGRKRVFARAQYSSLFPAHDHLDPLNQNRPQSVASSGTIAGLYARTDATRGVWKAPAGTDARLRGVQRVSPTDDGPGERRAESARRQLPAHFPVYGTSAGARARWTAPTQSPSDWKYVPVRRIALFIEESLYRGTKWVVFEPNDEPLWAQIRLNVGAFMHDCSARARSRGRRPQDAYLVKCDSETTTQTDIDNGIVNIVVGFAPLKPAEFVIIKIQQIAGQTRQLEEDRAMAQFTVNPRRFDPYKNFKFRVKWDGRYVAGVSKVGALKRTTEVVEHREGGDPCTGRKSPGAPSYEAITLERGVTHDLEFEQWANKVWNFGGGRGAEVSLEDFRKDIIIDLFNEAGQMVDLLQGLPLLGLRIPGAARPRRQRQRGRDPDAQARERGLGPRPRRGRAARA